MRVIILVLCVSLSGCTSYPLAYTPWPPAPQLNSCPELTNISTNATFSDVAKTIADNYNTYYTCRAQVQGWQDWYNQQKQIYESTQ